MTEEPLSLRDTARGVALRAGLLSIGALLISGWLLGVMMKVAGKAIHVLLVAGLGLIIGGIATYEMKKHLGSGDDERHLRVAD